MPILMNSILPNIYYFNPTCEYAIANGSESWQANQLLQKMESDLSILPLYFSKPTDYVIVSKIPSAKFLQRLSQLQIQVPNFILKERMNEPEFESIPKNKLLPWGWSPAMHHRFRTLKESCSSEFKLSPIFNWQKEHRNISSRKFALEILKQLTDNLNPDFIIPPQSIPQVCFTQREIEELIKTWEKLMIKAPWSSSGRGLQPITKAPVHPKVWEKILATIKNQGFVIVEPLLEKVFDYAFEFELNNGKVDFVGISYFITNTKGQYEGNNLNGIPHNLDEKLVAFIKITQHEILSQLIKTIENSILPKFYEGIFGVDVLVYLDENKKLKINPCLEINLRFNMGYLSLHVEKLILPEKKGKFSTFFQPGKTFHQFKNEMEVKYPLKVESNKIESGFLTLVDSSESTQFGAYLMV